MHAHVPRYEMMKSASGRDTRVQHARARAIEGIAPRVSQSRPYAWGPGSKGGDRNRQESPCVAILFASFEETCFRQVMLDKWLPLSIAGRFRRRGATQGAHQMKTMKNERKLVVMLSPSVTSKSSIRMVNKNDYCADADAPERPRRLFYEKF